MRLTIIDTQMNIVTEVLEMSEPAADLHHFSDFLARYRGAGWSWRVTPIGDMPASFQHDRHGLQLDPRRT